MSHLSLSFLVFGPPLPVGTHSVSGAGALNRRAYLLVHGKRRLE